MVASRWRPDGTTYVGLSFGPFDPEATAPLGKLVAASPAGALKWIVDTELAPFGGLAVDASSAVYAVTHNLPTLTLVGFDSDGAQRLSVVLDDPGLHPYFITNEDFFSSSVVLGDNGRLYVGSTAGRLHIIHP
jgi:hypothetical protein